MSGIKDSQILDKKRPEYCVAISDPCLVGITGLEPATPSSRTTCATNCAKSRLHIRKIPHCRWMETAVVPLSECKGKAFFHNREIFSHKNLPIQKKSVPLHPQSGFKATDCVNGAIAQLVEQRTENPCVPGSIPGGTTHRRDSHKRESLFLFIRLRGIVIMGRRTDILLS